MLRATPHARLLLLIGALVLGAAGCGGDSPSDVSTGAPDLNGRWEGLMSLFASADVGSGSIGSLVLDVEQAAGGALSGTGRIRNGIIFSAVMTLEGRFDPPILQLTLRRDDEVLLELKGESDEIGGRIDATFTWEGGLVVSDLPQAGVVQLLKRGSGS